VGKTEWRHGAHGTNEKELTRERRVAPLPGEAVSGLLGLLDSDQSYCPIRWRISSKNVLRLTFWLRINGKSVVPAGG
jgi:hypothetical protein